LIVVVPCEVHVVLAVGWFRDVCVCQVRVGPVFCFESEGGWDVAYAVQVQGYVGFCVWVKCAPFDLGGSIREVLVPVGFDAYCVDCPYAWEA